MKPLTLFLLIILGLLLLAGVIIFIIYPKIAEASRRKKKHSRLEQKFKPSSFENNMVQTDSNNAVRHLQDKISGINQRLSALEQRVENLDQKILSTQTTIQEKTEIDEDKGTHSKNNYPKIEFYTSHKSGVFDRSKSYQSESSKTFYKVESQDLEGAIYLLTGKMDSILIADKDVYLDNVCEITYGTGGDSKTIVEANPGKVELKGDQWFITEKVKIKIQ